MPALRDRGGDISLLAAFLLRKIAAEFDREVVGFTQEAHKAMEAHSWPGNVREMIAAIRRAVVMGTDPLINSKDLVISPRNASTKAATKLPHGDRVLRPKPGSDQEFKAIHEALIRNRENVTKAAADLGISRVTFYRMLKRHGKMPETVFLVSVSNRSVIC